MAVQPSARQESPEPPNVGRAWRTTTEGSARSRSARLRLGPALILGGLLAIGVAVAGIAFGHNADTAAPSRGSPIAPEALGTITVRSASYEPGDNSGWHRHLGVHVVTVLSGRLTIYDGQCVATTSDQATSTSVVKASIWR
jgi:hypothetical protein